MVAVWIRPWRRRVMYWSIRSSVPLVCGLDQYSNVA
jgi:hypothetical protein